MLYIEKRDPYNFINQFAYEQDLELNQSFLSLFAFVGISTYEYLNYTMQSYCFYVNSLILHIIFGIKLRRNKVTIGNRIYHKFKIGMSNVTVNRNSYEP